VGFAEATAKPNIILINLDDADAELFSEETLSTRFPNLHALAGRSVKFNNVHATTPLCGPSRACLLRAQYAHRCGIRVNEPDVPNAYGFDGGMKSYLDRGYASNDLSTWMQDAGYHTIQVGKFLHHQTVFTIPEGWDDFYSSVGGHYYDTYRITNRNGPGPYAERLADGVYRTNAEADDSVALIQQRTISNDGKPFFMFLNPYGPHRQQEGSQEMYDAKYANLWNNATMPASPAYDEEDVSDLSGPVKTMNRLNPYAHGYVARHYRERLLAMKSVDDMVGDIVAVLKNRGIEDNTYIFVTSDNGFALGHNRLVSKGIPSNRSTNVPLLVSGPGVIPDETDHLLAHIDLGPTIVQLAGGRTPNFVDGVSFARLIADPQNPRGVRDNVLIENFETRSMFGQNKEFASAALRLKNGLYIEWATGGREYFNLSNDPEQLSNIYKSIAPQTRTTFANILRRSKQWSPAEASFRVPYYDLEELEYPYVLEGIAESTVATRIVKLAIRDMTTQKYWDGNNWSPTFKQVTANLEHRNGILTCWNLPLEFGNQAPTGLVKAWVWGLDWSSNFEAPDTVVFRLGESQTKVSLQSPTFAQRFNGTSKLHGLAISGVQPELDEVQLFIRNVNNGQFWNGQSFSRRKTKLPTRRNGSQWSHNASLPQGTYRVSVNGLDSDGNIFDVTHRLFYVDD
jgi:arylsulfatase A-like enzyme